jgi:short-subunit dehydrogenase
VNAGDDYIVVVLAVHVSAYGFGCNEARTQPASLKEKFDSLPPVVPSLSEALQPFSAVIVTGGSSGIGKSFIQLGRTLKPDLVFCNLSRREPEKNISPNVRKKLNHFSCDLSRSPEIERAAAAVGEFLLREVPVGRILLINSSGFGAFGAVSELELTRELEMIDVNVRALVHLTGRLLPLLRTRGGTILNIASTVAFQPTPFAATYGATKAFVLHWTLALNEEMRGSNVRAIAVCPGTTATDFFRQAGVRTDAFTLSGALTPEAVVRSALRAMARGRSQIVPGWGNKAYTFAGARLSKPLAARIAGRFISPRRPKPIGR